MKKIIGVVLVVVFVLSLTVTTAASSSALSSANVGTPSRYLYTNAMDNGLVTTNGKATCKTVVTGLSSVTRIEATQYLQKWNGSAWNNVSGAVWSDSTNSRRLSMTNEKSGLSSGTYRIYAVATVYAGTNSEVVTGYSGSVTV